MPTHVLRRWESIEVTTDAGHPFPRPTHARRQKTLWSLRSDSASARSRARRWARSASRIAVLTASERDTPSLVSASSARSTAQSVRTVSVGIRQNATQNALDTGQPARRGCQPIWQPATWCQGSPDPGTAWEAAPKSWWGFRGHCTGSLSGVEFPGVGAPILDRLKRQHNAGAAPRDPAEADANAT